jgi:phospholipid N-methyltransferase
MSRSNTTNAATKKSVRWSSAALLKTAESLDRQAEDKFCNRPTHTPRMLKHARTAEREGAQMRRAAEFIRAVARVLAEELPADILGQKNFQPTKQRFLEIAARKGVLVGNGYHSYYVDGNEWQDTGPEAEAIRDLAASVKSPEQQQADAELARQAEIKRMVDGLRNVDIEGFFPTPDRLIDQMITAADMQDGHSILEPSAGIGSICDRVKATFPHVDLDAVELRPAFQELLKAKGHAVVGGDFIAWDGNGRQYDRVLMNPPFEKGTDMAHVRQAFNYVKGGGRLVAIMSNGFRFRQTSRATGFRAWLEQMAGDVVELSDDAFNGSNAFRRTGVKAVMVIVRKPGRQEAEKADRSTNRAAPSMQSGSVRSQKTLDA